MFYFALSYIYSRFFIHQPWLNLALKNRNIPLHIKKFILEYNKAGIESHSLTWRKKDDFFQQIYRSSLYYTFFRTHEHEQNKDWPYPFKFLFLFLSPISLPYLCILISSAYFGIVIGEKKYYLPIITISLMLWAVQSLIIYKYLNEKHGQREDVNSVIRFQMPYLPLIDGHAWRKSIGYIFSIDFKSVATILFLTILPYTITILSSLYA